MISYLVSSEYLEDTWFQLVAKQDAYWMYFADFCTRLPRIIERELLNRYSVLTTANYLKNFSGGVMNGFCESNGRINHLQLLIEHLI